METGYRGVQNEPAGPPPEDDFISLRDMVKMVLKHRRRIAAFTTVVTLIAGAAFFATPRKHGAAAVLQVSMPERADPRSDRDEHEANILSHQEYLNSPAMALRTAEELQRRGVETGVFALRRSVTVSRPPRTNLLIIKASAKSEDEAIAMAKAWRAAYMDVLSEQSVQRAIELVRRRVALLHDEWLTKTSQAAELRRHAEALEDEKTITLSRSIEEGELWKRLADGADERELKKLSDIHFKNEEFNQEYMMIRNALMHADRDSHSAAYMLAFYGQALDILTGEDEHAFGLPVNDGEKDSLARRARSYVNLLLDMRDVFAIGEPSPVPIARGAGKRTVVVLFAAFFVASAAALGVEWLRNQQTSAL